MLLKRHIFHSRCGKKYSENNLDVYGDKPRDDGFDVRIIIIINIYKSPGAIYSQCTSIPTRFYIIILYVRYYGESRGDQHRCR